MEFVIVTQQKPKSSGLKGMTVMSMPDPLLVYTGCSNVTEFSNSIVHMTFHLDYMARLIDEKYVVVTGTIVFRHMTTFRTAVMCMVSEKILLDNGSIYSINKVNNIVWQDDDLICQFLGILEAKVRLGLIKCHTTIRTDYKYHAIASADLTLSDNIKHQLRFLKCEFNVNIVYKDSGGTRTRRSTLFPSSLLDCQPISHSGTFSIITMKPQPIYVFSSADHKEMFGVDAIIGQGQSFEEFVAQYHTPQEMNRIRHEVIPRMHEMHAGDEIAPIIEFLTPRGPESFIVTIRNIGRSCMAVTFEKVDEQCFRQRGIGVWVFENG